MASLGGTEDPGCSSEGGAAGGDCRGGGGGRGLNRRKIIMGSPYFLPWLWYMFSSILHSRNHLRTSLCPPCHCSHTN